MPLCIHRHRLTAVLLRTLPTVVLATAGRAQSPMNLPLKEGGTTRIECRWDRDEALPGFDPDKKPERGAWHYDVFVPDGYSAQKERRYPCLFVSSPNGEAKNVLPLYKDWLAQHEWLAVMLAESRNGPIEPCLGNFLSAHDDAIHRLRIIDTMKAAAGMSGAARVSSLYVQVRPGFRGLFLQAAGFSQSTAGRYWMLHMPAEGSLSVFLTLGRKDPNLTELDFLRDALPPGAPYFPRLFDGGHTTPPPDIAAGGMDWLAHHMWLSATTDRTARAGVPAVVKRLAEGRAKAASPAARFALLLDIAGLVKAHRLAAHPDIASMMSGFSQEFSELKKAPAVILEMKAAAVLTTMRDRQRQTAIRAAKLTDADARKAAWLEFCSACEAAAAPFSETRAGKECRLLAEGLLPAEKR